MHLTKSQLLIGTLLLFLLLSCTFMVYQYNHEEHLHTTSLQNELQSINERIYSILEFKYNNTYSNNCAAEIKEIQQDYPDIPLRISIISTGDGTLLYDTSDDAPIGDNHLTRPEIAEALATGVGYDKRSSTLTPEKDNLYSATYNKNTDYIIRSAVPYNTRNSGIYHANHSLLIFEITITLLFTIFIYLMLMRMKATQTATEKLLAHLRISQEGLAIYNKNRRLILANKHFSKYADLISSKYLSDSSEIIYTPELYNVRMFLDKNETPKNANETIFADKIEKDSRTYTIQCVRFKDDSFEISITDTTQSEAQFRLKQQLTQNIAHEFKTPVCTIQGYIETILDNYPEKISEEQTKHFLQRCYTQSNRLNNLVQDMSQLMEISANSQYIEKEQLNLSSIIKNLLQEATGKLEELQITVNNTLPDYLPINGNSTMLHSIFRNLLDNTISYSGGKCQIDLNCYRTDEEYYYISFSDTGAGIPTEHLNRIFERFYRVDKGRSRKLGGTGLGLAIVKNAIILHGGTISARQNKGGGLEFVFTLRR